MHDISRVLKLEETNLNLKVGRCDSGGVKSE